MPFYSVIKFVKSLGEPVRAENPHLILLQVKLGHIPNIFPQTRRLAKFSKAQIGQSRLFSAFFFGFSNITAKLFILEEKFCVFKFRSH